MGVRIDTRVGQLDAQRAAKQTTGRAAPGPTLPNQGAGASAGVASLAIPDRFNTRIRQYNQDVAGLQTGISAIQTADKGLKSQQSDLEKLRGLAEQAAGGTLSAEQQAAVNKQAGELLKNINKTAENTTFNGVKVLKPAAKPNEANAAGANAVNIQASTTETLGVNALDLGTQENAASALKAVNTALARVSQNRAGLAAQNTRLTQQVEQRQAAINTGQAELKRFQNVQAAQQVIEQTRNLALSQNQAALVAQGNINPGQAARLLGK